MLALVLLKQGSLSAEFTVLPNTLMDRCAHRHISLHNLYAPNDNQFSAITLTLLSFSWAPGLSLLLLLSLSLTHSNHKELNVEKEECILVPLISDITEQCCE